MEQPPDATDTALLTYLATVDGATAATVAAERDLTLPAALARLGELERRGLVISTAGGTYELDEAGRAYLDGEEPVDESLPHWARRRPSWMQRVDVEILAALADGEVPLALESLVAELDHPVEQIGSRIEELAAQGLVQPVDEESVRLRDLGRAFVEGDLDSTFLESE